MYLVTRGANLENKDIYGNTSLGVGLMYQHYNYGIILIQKEAKVHPLTFFENPEEIKKRWEAEEKAKKALYKTQLKKDAQKLLSQKSLADDEDMDSENDDDKFVTHVYKKHQDMFGKSGVLNNGLYGNEYDEEEEDEESEDEDDQHQENVFNQQNAFGMQVFGNRRPVTRFNGGFGFNQFNQFG